VTDAINFSHDAILGVECGQKENPAFLRGFLMNCYFFFGAGFLAAGFFAAGFAAAFFGAAFFAAGFAADFLGFASIAGA
jgi:hypothetical protein